jgi:hypothetical protein
MPQIPILLQQPSYTIHTSLAATQTADFSEAEESTDSDDNDDRLSWQKVGRRGKKRASRKTTGVSTLKKNKPQGTNNSTTQIITTNKSEPLRHAETEGNSGHERKDPAQPPIFVAWITHLQRLTATSKQVVVVNRSNCALKIINSDTIKITTNQLENHKTITDILKEKKVEFHIYQPRQ